VLILAFVGIFAGAMLVALSMMARP